MLEAGLGAGAASLLAPRFAAAQPARRSRLILLGTKGGPTPSRFRAPASNLLIVDGVPFVIDAPDGVAERIVRAGVALDRIGEVFITHNHSDHSAGLGALLVLAWGSGLRTPVTIRGPAPLARLVAGHLAANDYDIQIRMSEEARIPLAPLISTREISAPGVVLETPAVRVSCAFADHYHVPDIAYRFDTPDRSFVFSGDTRPSDHLIALARGADVLVHEVIMLSALGSIGNDGNARNIMDHLVNSHADVGEVGRVAAAAGVRTLVLSHLVPASPDVTDAMWIAPVRRHFHGRIIVGRDMMEL